MRAHKGEDKVNNVYATLHMRAKAAAERKKLTISELSAVSTITKERLEGILEGDAREITLSELAALAIALDIRVTDLLSPDDG